MLIKLPNSITTTEHLAELITALKDGRHKAVVVQDFLESNPRLDPLQAGSGIVIEYLQNVHNKPKLLKFSFAQMPDSELISELAFWARHNIDDQVLIEVKVEPLLVGGFVLRTPQRQYDFSWNTKAIENRGLLERLVGVVS